MEWGLTRPHNPAARGELLGATAPWRNRSRTKKNKPTLNTKLRILPVEVVQRTDLTSACWIFRSNATCSDTLGGPASWHHAGRSSFRSRRLPVSFLDWPPPLEDPTPAKSGSPTDCACRLPSPQWHRDNFLPCCELLASIAQTSLSGYLPGFVQHAIRVSTVTKVQSDRDLFLIPSDCVVHKASSLPTRSIARAAYSAFSSNLNGWPAGSPVNASSRTSRCATHDSGPVWFAIPFLLRTFTFALCRSPGALTYDFFRFVIVAVEHPQSHDCLVQRRRTQLFLVAQADQRTLGHRTFSRSRIGQARQYDS
jgi:hypothetical protein